MVDCVCDAVSGLAGDVLCVVVLFMMFSASLKMIMPCDYARDLLVAFDSLRLPFNVVVDSTSNPGCF